MKKLSLVFAIVFTSGFAMAQSNTSTVGQTGNGNSALIDQIGSLNESTVNQKSFGTMGGVPVSATADIYQKGSENKSIVSMQDAFYGFTTVEVDQVGMKNEARLQTQNGGGSAIINMVGDENKLKGLGGDLFANQKNVNTFNLDITGSKNIVGMSQEFGTADIDVLGSNNGIEVRQLAQYPGYNVADIDVDGSNNTINVDQADITGGTGGLGNLADIELLSASDFNNVSVMQRGSGHQSYNTVTGDLNTISVSQHD